MIYLKLASLYEGLFRSSWAPYTGCWPWLQYTPGQRTVPDIGDIMAIGAEEEGLDAAVSLPVFAGVKVLLVGRGRKSRRRREYFLSGSEVQRYARAFWSNNTREVDMCPTGYQEDVVKKATVLLSSFTPFGVVGVFSERAYAEDVWLAGSSGAQGLSALRLLQDGGRRDGKELLAAGARWLDDSGMRAGWLRGI